LFQWLAAPVDQGAAAGYQSKMQLLLVTSLAGVLLIWSLAGTRAGQGEPPRHEPEVGTRSGVSWRVRLLGGLGAVLQLPVLVVVPVLLWTGELSGAVNIILALIMLVLPVGFALLGIRLLLGRVEPRQDVSRD
jgi:hypothetical protein